MRYRLRTLMVLLAVGPPALAVVWWAGVSLSSQSWSTMRFTSLGIIAFLLMGILGAIVAATAVAVVVLLVGRGERPK